MCLCSFARTAGHLLALLAQFAHDLCDVHGSAGGHLGLQLQLLLPEDDGAEAGAPLPGILLQLGVTRIQRKVCIQICFLV